MSILVIGEQQQGQLTPATLRILGACMTWQESIHVLVVCSQQDEPQLHQHCARISVIERLLIQHPNHSVREQPFHPFSQSMAIMSLIAQYRGVVMPHAIESVALLGRISGRCGYPLLTDITQFEYASETAFPSAALQLTFDTHGGLWFPLETAPLLLTLRASCFEPVSDVDNRRISLPVEQRAAVTESCGELQTLVLDDHELGEGQVLEEARIVVAGGRPLGKRLMERLTPLSAVLHAATGATRGAVEAGFAPIAWQIGMTGAHIAPDLYLAVAISGAPQHLAGIGQSGCIIVINKDASAPIVEQADYFLQGDMQTLLPELVRQLQARRADVGSVNDKV
ncbi:electron transfer flavoprotein subunit alpha/FixB family protein [Celerinatantimonas sp. YJH-8]|uniref:electron transfer flavoprotein subunit alpha/FixB family protein n=1 Tax=Celerinatantimonas sp. YJH-8 TaxID=3228714 RepID=UPI0038C5933A